MAWPTLHIADDHVRDTAALATRQPGGDEGIGPPEFRIDPERPAREEYRHDGYAGRPQLGQESERLLVVRLEFERAKIAQPFGIRFLAENNDGDVRFLGEAAIGAQRRVPAARRHGFGQASVDRLRVREIGVGIAVTLPR